MTPRGTTTTASTGALAGAAALLASAVAVASPGGDEASSWPYSALARPDVPAHADDTWSRGEIDRFVLARQRDADLEPNAEADRPTLIRRVTLDLTGLPPTPEEVDAFLRDDQPGAYERVVDRLLASPHFGERWASHWLDVARFAESHGFEHDYDRPHAYHYRDFVIQAFNEDMPFTQFVRWQVAGDEEAPDTPLALMATGFLGAGVFPTQITKNEVERTRYDALDDMAATVGTAFLGLTVGCARCHDHEYDPISMREYYGFVSHFTTTVRSTVDVDMDPEGHARALAEYEREHAPLADELERYEREELPGAFADYLAALPRPATADAADLAPVEWGAWRMAGPFSAESGDAAFDTNYGPEAPVATDVEWVDRPELTDGKGHTLRGELAATYLERTVVAPSARTVKLALGSDDAIRAWVGDALVHDHRVRRGLTVGQDAVEVRLERGENRLLLKVVNYGGGYGFSFEALEERTADGVPLRIARLLAKETDAHAPAEADELLAWYRERDPGWRERHDRVQAHLAQRPRPNVVPVQVSTEGLKPMRHHTQGADFFETTYLLARGDPNQKLEPASPSYPAVLVRGGATNERWHTAPPEGARTSYRRTSLAKWLTDVEHGAGNLLARVIVNRLWQHHFGRGIVATPGDFGNERTPATHPDLLEWLACELVGSGWSLKSMHRRMVTSATYRQDGAHDPRRAALDPENLLLWRRAPARSSAEAVRDSILAVSGALDRTMYGPGTLNAAQGRRSVYLTVKRSKLVPELQIFDAPDTLQGRSVRSETIVAPQALYLMNDRFVRHCAERFAKEIGGGTVEQAVEQGYQRALTREPRPSEKAQALVFLAEQEAAYAQRGLTGAAEHALADFCQLLFGLNEFLYAP